MVTVRGDGVSVMTPVGQWHASLPGSPPLSAMPSWRAWSLAWLRLVWPESLQHAVSLAAAVGQAAVDLAAYERLLPAVRVDLPVTPAVPP